MHCSEMDNRFDRLVYASAYHLYQPLARLAFGLQVSGRGNIPLDGAAIVASNHRTFLDTLALPYGVRDRHISMVARDDFSDGQIIKWLFKHLEIVPIRRGAFNIENYRAVNERLEAGRLVGIYPEETRGDRQMRKTDLGANLGPFKPGVAKFAASHEIPTIPAAVSGLDNPAKAGQRRVGRVAFGEPLAAPGRSKSSRADFLDELRIRIERLYNQNLAAKPVAENDYVL